MPSNPFRKFYRYRTLNIQTFESLLYDSLYFSAPETFNDPLDCQPSLVLDTDVKSSNLLLRELIQNRIKKKTLSTLKRMEVMGEAAETYATQHSSWKAGKKISALHDSANDPSIDIDPHEAITNLLLHAIQSELIQKNQYGICCFADDGENPLLWSHYADQHKGICIGYNDDRDPVPKLQEIQYDENRTIRTSLVYKAIVSNDHGAKQDLYRALFLQKASAWQYEKEWRLIREKGVHPSPLKLIDITFGMRCQTAMKYALIQTLVERQEEVNFFDITQQEGTYRLKRRPLIRKN